MENLHAGASKEIPAQQLATKLEPGLLLEGPTSVSAGSPFRIDVWDRRYRQPWNRRSTNSRSHTREILGDGSSTLDKFLNGDFRQRPALLPFDTKQLPSTHLSGWAGQATVLAAQAVELDRAQASASSSTSSREPPNLVVVNPADFERKKPDPLAAAALAVSISSNGHTWAQQNAKKDNAIECNQLRACKSDQMIERLCMQSGEGKEGG
eukprot:SAG31_NODE_506_length_14749_cov_8.119181_3_plen_209_part_00